jgi:8-oxo-dGTP diphosphatase
MINVTCAVIRNEDEEVLVVQRGNDTDHPLKWEFPGGKLNKGETEEECVIREVDEELSMDIIICGRLSVVEYDYGHKQIRLFPFICDTLDELPLLSEHKDYKWVTPGNLTSIDFSEADVFVAINYLEGIKFEKTDKEQLFQDLAEELPDDEELQLMINRMMSLKEAEWIAASAKENKAILKKLLDYSFSSDKKLAFHASWTLSKGCDKHPEMIYPYLPGIIERLNQINNESAQRSLLRIISLIDMSKINSKYHGLLADHCFNALRSAFSAIAIKAYSMEILYNLSLKYPELTNELSATIVMLQGEGSAGIKARGYIILKKLGEMPCKS